MRLMHDSNVKREILHDKSDLTGYWLEYLSQFEDCVVLRRIQSWLQDLRRVRHHFHTGVENTIAQSTNELVNGIELAQAYNLTDYEMASAMGTNVRHLRAYPAHTDFQPFLQAFRSLLHMLEGPNVSSSDVATWLRTENHAMVSSVPGTRPLTPWKMISDGRLGDVVHIVSATQEV